MRRISRLGPAFCLNRSQIYLAFPNDIQAGRVPEKTHQARRPPKPKGPYDILLRMSPRLIEGLYKVPLSLSSRRKVRETHWGAEHALSQSPNDIEDPYNPYLSFYEAQCASVTQHWAQELWVADHEELLKVIHYIKAGDQTRESIASNLHEQWTVADKASIDDVIALAARLLLMLSIGNPKHCLTLGQTMIDWNSGTLEELVTYNFSSKPVLSDHVKLPRQFNALQLMKIAGVKVAWTTNLVDHLLLQEDDTKVYIFHHASFLRCHRDGDCKLYGKDFINETLRTLKLLLPEHDKDTKRWFRNQQQRYRLDPAANKNGHLNTESRQIEQFRYWRDRLVILKQVFDESEPKNNRQWWNDRRSGVRWATFWVGFVVVLLTILFGLAQSVEGALQVYKSYHPSSVQPRSNL